ncbi:MAG: hypothetical protein GX638_15595, partial [Crenarchaeota archaeon]|nr:hypothetical protein [Thermoproteota archaeon]
MFLKTRYRILTLLIIGIVLLSAAAISIETFFTSQRQMQTSPFFVGVELGWHANLTEAKAEIDQVKSYANLLVIGTGTLTANETILNETCDYGYNAGMYLIVFWYDWNESPRKTYDSTTVGNFNENSYHPYEWIGRAKEKYGEYFLGAYYFDELGGKKLDQQETPLSYKELANNFVKNANIEPFLSLNHQVGSLLFTSDYGLYWFDYKAGYDVVLAQFGWNNSRQLQVGLARGAAAIQNKDWGVMITWTYTNTPYLETGSQLYEDLVMAYNSGAKYAVIYDASQGYSKSTLTEDHLKAMQDFWLYTQQNPQMHGCIKPDTALVLPEDYGFGFRDINDSVWGVRQTGDWHQEIYQYVTHLINEYGLRLDIVYRDIQFDNITKNLYPNPIYWTAGEKGDCLAVINVRSTMGYANIQEAINSSATYSGDTLFVKQGTYYENIVIGKSVVLLGEDENRTIIDGKNQGTALHITSNNTTVTGFTICNGGNLTTKSTGGVVLHNAFNCNITSNNIVSNNIGLLIFESAN